MEIRPLTQEERKYTYPQSMQLQGQTGSIGHLQGNFGIGGTEYNQSWIDYWERYKPDDFQRELDGIVNALRSGECGLLADRNTMKAYVAAYPDSAFHENHNKEYGFRIDTDRHAYLIRCNPSANDTHFYCYCYKSEYLDRHMANAAKGIRFIDSRYKELFCIPDGEKITVTLGWGKKKDYACRYIDEYHTEVGGHLYHICEFTERMEQNGAVYEPKQQEKQKEQERGR